MTRCKSRRTKGSEERKNNEEKMNNEDIKPEKHSSSSTTSTTLPSSSSTKSSSDRPIELNLDSSSESSESSQLSARFDEDEVEDNFEMLRDDPVEVAHVGVAAAADRAIISDNEEHINTSHVALKNKNKRIKQQRKGPRTRKTMRRQNSFWMAEASAFNEDNPPSSSSSSDSSYADDNENGPLKSV